MPTRIFLDETPLRLQTTATDSLNLPLDVASLLASGLRHFPPSEHTLEHAIALVEDALMPLIPVLQRHPLDRLHCEGAFMPELGRATGVDPTAETVHLSIATLEDLFNRIADIAAGMPARTLHIPESTGFVATVLVSRELMHHAGYLQLEFTNVARPD